MKRQTVWEEIGKRIEAACLNSGKSMVTIAGEVGVTDEALRLWRRGQAFPTQQNWEALAEVLGISVRELLIEQKKERQKIRAVGR